MIVTNSKKSQKLSKVFNCTLCNYNTCKKNDYYKHIITAKHCNLVNDSKMIVDNKKKSQEKIKFYKCNCGKNYKYDSGYYRHKKQCNPGCNVAVKTIDVDSSTENKDTPSDKELMMMLIQENAKLIKDNNDFKQMMLEIVKHGTNNIHTNSHNKTFNLQFFLNETCKDAMNIMDFVESVKLQLSDLETIGNTGFANGISNIIIKNLKDLDVTKRPLHCTDSKREVMYVKDKNKWEKENDENEKMKKVINQISTKNIQQIPEWVEQYPNCKDSDSRKNNEYLHIVGESMGCCDPVNYGKIIHNISKQVIVDK